MAALPGSAIFTDGNANVQRLGFAIGGALLWGSAALFAPAQPKPQASQYEGGTQQVAVTLQAAGRIWPGRFIPTALPPPRRMAILAGPQFDPSQTAAAIFKQQPPNTVAVTPVPFKRIAAGPQSTEQGVGQNFADPFLWAPIQLFPSGQQFNLLQAGAESQSAASVVFKSFIQPTVARLISQIVVAPQDGPQGSGQLFTQQPPTALAPPLKGVVSAAPQADPAQLAAQVFHQQLQTQQVQTPSPFGLVWTAGQSDPSQTAPQLFKSLTASQSPPFARVVTPWQDDTSQPAAVVFKQEPAPFVAPAVSVFGTLVVVPQVDYSQLGSALFDSPAIFLPAPPLRGAIVVPPQADPTQIAAQWFKAPPANAAYPPFGLLMVGQREERYEGVNTICAPFYGISAPPAPPDVSTNSGGWEKKRKKPKEFDRNEVRDILRSFDALSGPLRQQEIEEVAEAVQPVVEEVAPVVEDDEEDELFLLLHA